MNAAALRAAVEQELHGNLLPFWRRRSVDSAAGGFIAEMANDGAVRRDAAKGLILNARLLWTFAALYRCLGDERDLALAERSYDYLVSRFRDPEHGGFLWRLDTAGSPLERTKKVYGQAFCVYALSELHLATGRSEPLAVARDAYGLIERHAHDDRHLGYIEALAADWSETAEFRLTAKDLDEAKSMNTHLHLLEAYANLYRAWPDAGLAARLEELIDLFGRHILERSGGRHQLHHFFDERWNVRSNANTYGHDIEAVWLLGEAAEVLGDERRRANVDHWAVGLARTVLAEGLDSEGGVVYQARHGSVIDPNREWWCQAEAVVGFWHAYRLTGEIELAEASVRVWRFIAASMVDRKDGEWFWRVRADGSVDQGEPKVSEWKGPYHSVRMCLEMMRRIERGANGQEL
jgi:mannobiose 2-epimerase